MTYAGKVVAVHGVAGEVVIAHEIMNAHAIKDVRVLMIEVWPESFIPFFIEKIRAVAEDEIIVKFEEVPHREEAKNLLNKKVYLYNSSGFELEVKTGWTELLGYRITDQHDTPIGQVLDISGSEMQTFAETEYRGRNILLPLHEDLVLGIDPENKIVQLQISEGLLDL